MYVCVYIAYNCFLSIRGTLDYFAGFYRSYEYSTAEETEHD